MFPVNNIRKICKIRDTTIAEVERDTKISNGTIAKWEDSPRSPQFDYLKNHNTLFSLSLILKLFHNINLNKH